MEAFVAQVVVDDLGASFVRITREFQLNRADMELRVQKTLKDAPLLAHISQVIMADDHVAAKIGSVGEDPFGRLFHEAKVTFQYVRPWLAQAFTYRRVDAEYMADTGPEDIPDELCDRHSDAFDAVLQTRPTTLAGLVALTTFVRDWTDYLCPHSVLSGETLCRVAAALDDLAKEIFRRQA